MRDSATAGLDVWQHASLSRPRLCSYRRWGMDCDMNTVSSGNQSRMDGSRRCRTTGSALLIPGRSLARMKRWKSVWVAHLS